MSSFAMLASVRVRTVPEMVGVKAARLRVVSNAVTAIFNHDDGSLF